MIRLKLLLVVLLWLGVSSASAQAPEDFPGDPGQDSGPSRGEGRSRDERQSGPGMDRRGGRNRGMGDGGNSGNSGRPGDKKTKVRVGRVGTRTSLPPTTLPAQYSTKDVNKDGQIGMYEWAKTDLSTFRKLDMNGDGFLTPAELTSPATTASTGSTTIVPGMSGKTAVSSTPAPSAPPADLKTVAAEGAFTGLDTDKNGELSDEEWQRSRYARKLFTEAKVEIKLPLTKAKFVESYIKLAP